MVRSGRFRANPTIHRMESEVRRSGRTSTGTWYVEPPTRRDFTSRAGLTLSTACLNSLSGSCLTRSPISSSASYMMCSERLRFPPVIMTSTNFATSRLPYFGSGATSRRWMIARRGINARTPDLGPAGLRRLGAVLGPTLPAIGHARRVEDPPDDVVAHPRQVLHATAPDEDDRVLLQVVPDPGDVGRDLDRVGEAHPGDLPQGRVRLLRRGRVHADTHPTLLRRALHEIGRASCRERGEIRAVAGSFRQIADRLRCG